MQSSHQSEKDKKEHSKNELSPNIPSYRKAAQPIKELHTCMGLNACKGHDYFGTNDCAGTGYCATIQHACHVLNDCRGQGGCGLFGTTKEFCHPGENECAFQGSCGSPIPSSRYIAQGPNKGKSVWQLARKLFEKRMAKVRRTHGESPMPYGPTLEWLGENVGWTDSCGQAGAKFCSFVSTDEAIKRRDDFVAESAKDMPETLKNCDSCDC